MNKMDNKKFKSWKWNDIGSEFGHFSENGREYIIENPITPAPWINYLTNGRYTALVSHTGGGFSYLDSPKYNRLTRFRYNMVPWDRPGRYIYIKNNKNGKYWSLTYQPIPPIKYNFFQCKHGQGYTEIILEYAGVRSEVVYFVPAEGFGEIWIVRLENQTSEEFSLDIYSYQELVLGNALNDLINDANHKHFPEVDFIKDINALRATSRYWVSNQGVSVKQSNSDWPYFLYFRPSLRIEGYATERSDFIGAFRSEENPIGIETGQMSCNPMTAGYPIFTTKSKFNLLPGEKKSFDFQMFVVQKDSEEEGISDWINRYGHSNGVKKALCEVKDSWSDYLSKFQAFTPHKEADLMINIWNPYQTAITYTAARDAGYYHGGLLFGRGVRDVCQDIMGKLIVEPLKVKKRVIEVLNKQFPDGSTLHNYFLISNNGEKTGHSDTPLWLPFAVIQYLKETADFDLLNFEVEYFRCDQKDTVLNHIKKAIDFVLLNLDERGLPWIGFGDWNDTLDHLGKKGVSIWVAQFLAYILVEMADLMLAIGNIKERTNYLRLHSEIKESIQKYAWDGKWFIRAINDCGVPIGSSKNKEPRIFLNTQSWAILSKVAEKQQIPRIIEEVKTHLFDKKGIAILSPPYTRIDDRVGLVTRCVPGKKENGAIFNHAVAWFIIACCEAGDGDLAFEVYSNTLPPVVSRDIRQYRTEPYVYSEYVTSRNHSSYGQASHSWLTGSAVWMQRAAMEYILGIRADYRGLLVKPCIPSNWTEYKAVRYFRGCEYQIHVLNPHKLCKGKPVIEVNGERWYDIHLPVSKEPKKYNVKVILEKENNID